MEVAASGPERNHLDRLDHQYNATSTSVGSKFSGGVVSLGANNDINIEGSHISGSKGVVIAAGKNLNIVEGHDTVSANMSSSSKTSGVGLPGGSIPMVGPIHKGSTTALEIQTDTASASTIQSGQDGVLLQGGNTVFLQAVVKTFNQLPAKLLAMNPAAQGGRRVMFVASDSGPAAMSAAKLVEEPGFAAITLGTIDVGGMLLAKGSAGPAEPHQILIVLALLI